VLGGFGPDDVGEQIHGLHSPRVFD
jgi:hypothetical protein